MKNYILSITLLTVTIHAKAQDFNTREWAAPAHNKPLIFYLSGDGGFNKFSTSLCEGLNAKGYDVEALSCRSYFWDKKTPEQAAADIKNFLVQKLNGRSNQQVVIIGYSFGADVLPFILNRLPADLKGKIIAACLMASSGSTDFEIHWSDILGGHSKRNMDVATELNKVTNQKIIIISASDDKDLDLTKVTIKYKPEVLPGGHHFDGDTDEIIRVIVNDMN
ncbi:MAG TPA: AcvB/VirJ family lysyl-phosphatidylglycerol hydrolase [Chitinophagaceae bacterium]|nr:AcvB/VirJ family lysyl-phosphatidylglycerol hydrolase [Chitinophagaceae bacterium]